MAGKPQTDSVLTVDWKDEGCAVWRACLSCPLPRCLDDYPGGADAVVRALRDRLIARLYGEGVPAVALARQFGVTTRAIYRALERVEAKQAA